jgi:outer membrane protein assembly factor BamA
MLYCSPLMRLFLTILILFATYTHGYAQTISIQGKNDTVPNTRAALQLPEQVKLRSIHIYGNKITRRSIILREMSVKEDDILVSDSIDHILDINHKRLFNQGLFADINLYVDKTDDSSINLVVRLKERWYWFPEVAFQLADRNFNVWWSEQNHDIRRANIRLTIKDRNFRGNMETLSATVQVGYTQKFALDYSRPYIDKKQRHGIGGSISFAKNEETFFTTDSNKLKFVRTPRNYIYRQFEAGLSYTYRHAYAVRHLVELRYRDAVANDTIVTLNRDYYLNGSRNLRYMQLLYRTEVNKVDNWNYPMKGDKLVTYAVFRQGIEGMQYQAFLQAEYGWFRQLGKSKFYVSEIARGRVTFPERNQPYVLRYAMGNESEYLRGYEYYVIDGSHYGLLRSNLKYELLNVNIKDLPFRYLPSIPLRLYPKVFADVGYVYNRFPFTSYLNNRPLYSAGFGIDIVSAYDMKIRVEYAFNHLGEKGIFLHLNAE